MSSLNKIHVNSSTGLTLNDRFTAMSERRVRTRSQSRNNVPAVQSVNPNVASANRRLLLQLERRHKMLAAMKLKRRSLRQPPGAILKRGSIKAFRVAANGKPIKANTLTKIATMNADLISNGKRRSRSLRRAGSVTPVANRLGVRPGRGIGGAAERVAKRRMARLRTQLKRGDNYIVPDNRRSRSRLRAPRNNFSGVARGPSMNRGRPDNRVRSQSRGRSGNRGRSESRGRSQNRGRSQSRSRLPVANSNVRRGRSKSRNRAQITANRDVLPVKARLGVRTDKPTGYGRHDRNINGGRNVMRGRIQKRPGGVQNGQNKNGTGGKMFQARGRSRSRTRKGPKQQLDQVSGARNGRMVRRGRSRQRGFGNSNSNGMKNMKNNQQQRQQQPQQRRGRSRSRRGDGRNLGKTNMHQAPNKDELDKELDQYMATTKTENDMGYLLRN